MISTLAFFVLLALVPLCAANCTPACTVGEQFCNSNSQCEDINYADVVTPTAVTLPASPSAFSVVMASDVQTYYLKCKEAPDAACIHLNSANSADLDAALAEQVTCINTFVNNAANNVKAIFDGGDLTNAGLGTELTAYKTHFYTPLQSAAAPLFLNLGNHDYYNIIPKKRARKRMIDFLAESLQSLAAAGNSVSSIDFKTATEDDYSSGALVTTKYTKGSLGYTVDIEGFVFVFMHWGTALKNNGIYIDQFETAGTTPKAVFTLTDIETYLTSVFADTNNVGKKFVLVPHSIRTITKFICQYASAATIASFDSKVVGILSGHDHDQWGFYGTYDVYKNGVTENCPNSGVSSSAFGTTGNIPVYYAGSATYQTLIKANFDFSAASPVSADAYTTDPLSSNQCLNPITPDTSPEF